MATSSCKGFFAYLDFSFYWRADDAGVECSGCTGQWQKWPRNGPLGFFPDESFRFFSRLSCWALSLWMSTFELVTVQVLVYIAVFLCCALLYEVSSQAGCWMCVGGEVEVVCRNWPWTEKCLFSLRIHGLNERISIENYEKQVEFLFQLMKNCDIETLPEPHASSHELWDIWEEQLQMDSGTERLEMHFCVVYWATAGIRGGFIVWFTHK